MGRTGKTEDQTEVGGESEVRGSETAGTGVVFEEEVEWIDQTEVQTGVGVGRTGVRGSRTAVTVVCLR